MARQINFDPGNYNTTDLKVILELVQAELKRRTTVYVKTVFKKCGKADCTCNYGSLEDYGHGPYLYAIWRENGRQVQRSLGTRRPLSWFEKLARDPEPRRVDFCISPQEYAKLPEDKQRDYVNINLTYQEFFDRYEIYPEEDKLGRPNRIWLAEDQYQIAMLRYQDNLEIVYNDYKYLGVSTLKGIRLLNRLRSEGHTIY